jgi:hypothetical protein
MSAADHSPAFAALRFGLIRQPPELLFNDVPLLPCHHGTATHRAMMRFQLRRAASFHFLSLLILSLPLTADVF